MKTCLIPQGPPGQGFKRGWWLRVLTAGCDTVAGPPREPLIIRAARAGGTARSSWSKLIEVCVREALRGQLRKAAEWHISLLLAGGLGYYCNYCVSISSSSTSTSKQPSPLDSVIQCSLCARQKVYRVLSRDFRTKDWHRARKRSPWTEILDFVLCVRQQARYAICVFVSKLIMEEDKQRNEAQVKLVNKARFLVSVK